MVIILLEASFYIRKVEKIHQKYPLLGREHTAKYKYLSPINWQI